MHESSVIDCYYNIDSRLIISVPMGGRGGGAKLADIFFPILPENLTSHQVQKVKIFPCERQKKF